MHNANIARKVCGCYSRHYSYWIHALPLTQIQSKNIPTVVVSRLRRAPCEVEELCRQLKSEKRESSAWGMWVSSRALQLERATSFLYCGPKINKSAYFIFLIQARCSARKRRNAPRSLLHRTLSTVCTPRLIQRRGNLLACLCNGRISWTLWGGPNPS